MADWLKSLSEAASSLGRDIVALMRRVRRPFTFAASRFFIRLHINQSHVTVVRSFLLWLSISRG